MHFLSINWRPNDTLFDLGFIEIKYYSLMFIIAFSLGYVIMKKIYTNLGEVFFYSWHHYQDHLIEILLPIKEDPNAALFGFIKGYKFIGFKGLASHGAAVGIITAMILYRRKYKYKTTVWILDRIVIPVASAGVFIRLGNFFNSEIVGKYTGTDFGVVFLGRGESLPRHPAQLYEAFCYIFVFLALWYTYWKTDKKDKTGYIFGLFLVLLWSVRFFVEFVKIAQVETRNDWALTTGQWLSIPLILVGFYFMFRTVKTKEA